MRSSWISVLRFFLFFSIFSINAPIAQAQYIQTERPNIFINADCNGYLETLPQEYAGNSQSYPLLVFLEGIQEAGNGSFTDLQKLYNNGPPYLIKNGLFPPSFSVNGQTFKFIIITPQFTIPLWDRYPTPAEINGIIDYMVQHYRVDQSRIYLTGLSTGGGSVFYYAGASSVYANRLAAIVPFASTYGTSDPAEFTKASVYPRARVMSSANLPVWGFHNRFDSGVPDSITRNYVSYMNESPTPNPPAKATIFDAAGHECWYHAYNSTYTENNMSIYQWMLQYKRGAASNQPPLANAGQSQTITLPVSSVTLNGSASDPDGFVTSYSWSKTGGPAQGTINSPSSASTTVSGLAQGVYTFRLTVTDNGGATASSTVTVTVNAAANQSPTANAGSDQSITLPTSSVNLSGSGSDPDGTISSYSWSKVSGGNVSFSTPSSPSTTVSGLTQGTYIFRLTVTDNNGATASDDVVVTVSAAANQSPTVNAGSNQTITLPTSSVTLSGSATDADGSITSYSWSKQSGGSASITTPSAASTTVTGLVQGVYVFRLTATDNGGASNFADVTVTVNAAPSGGGSTTRIEAENWTAMSGVFTENAWGDPQGGGLIVGWIEQGDWMDYFYNAPTTGTYTVKMRVATPLTGAQLQIRNSSGTVLQTVSVPNTGGWQTWTTITTSVNLTAGGQTLRLFASNTTGWNINWWELTSPGSPSARLRSDLLLNERGQTLFNFYPNPVQNGVSVLLDNDYAGSLTLQIIGVNGAIQREWKGTKQKGSLRLNWNLGHLAGGSYIIKAEGKGWTETRQLVKY
jgi:hypothetical protein